MRELVVRPSGRAVLLGALLLGADTAAQRAVENCWCLGPLAVMTSGQAARVVTQPFVGQSTGGALFDQSGASCAPTFDMYAVLSANSVPSYFQPTHRDPPEQRRDAPMRQRQLVAEYKSLGARAVSVELVQDADLEAAIARTELEMSQRGAARLLTTPARFWAAAMALRGVGARWPQHGKMFHLRHLAFQTAYSSATRYAFYLFVREDNLWLAPPGAALAAFVHESACADGQPVPSPYVMVDQQGGWGHPSDKMYLANAAGAKVLFGSSWDEHIDHLTSWITLAMLPSQAQHVPG